MKVGLSSKVVCWVGLVWMVVFSNIVSSVDGSDTINGSTSLSVRVPCSQNDKVELILEELERMDSKDKITRIFQVVKYHDLYTIKRVLDTISQTMNITEIWDEKERSLIHVASKYRDFAIVEYLVKEQGFSRNLTRYAVEFHNFIVRLVSTNNTKRFTAVDEGGETVLHKTVKEFPVLNSTLDIFKEHDVDFNAINEAGDSAFFNAVHHGRNASFLATLINYGVNWTTRNDNNDTALHVAALYGNLPAVNLLLSLGSDDVNAQNSKGRTPLHQAVLSTDVSQNNYAIVSELVKNGANVSISDKNGELPLQLANSIANTNELKKVIVEVLDGTFNRSVKLSNILNELEQLESNSTLMSRLFQIVQTEDLDTIKSVLEHVGKKSTNITEIWDEKLHSLLHAAIKYRDDSIVEYLINSTGFTKKLNDSKFNGDLVELCMEEIHTVLPARFEQKSRILQLLFRIKPELIETKLGIRGRTPLLLSTARVFTNGKQLELIKMLIDNNANVNAIDTDANSTALHLAGHFNPLSTHLMEIIRTLIKNHADANAIDKWGETFLIKVAWKCTPVLLHEVVEYLDSINNTYSFTIINTYGKTALHVAVYYMEVRNETLGIFKRRGVDFNARDNSGNSILFFAIYGGRNGLVLKNLIAFGADWRLKSNSQFTSLHVATIWGNLEALKLLIGLGADVNALNSNGYTPLHQALTDNRIVTKLEVVNELIKHGADVNIKSKSGELPIDAARKKSLQGKLQEGIIQLLESTQNPVNSE